MVRKKLWVLQAQDTWWTVVRDGWISEADELKVGNSLSCPLEQRKLTWHVGISVQRLCILGHHGAIKIRFIIIIIITIFFALGRYIPEVV